MAGKKAPKTSAGSATPVDLGAAFDLRVERMAPGGDGIGFHDGLAVFVPLAAPGDSLRVRPVERKKDFLRASIAELLEPSPIRSPQDLCPLYAQCGGCNLGHIRYDAQLNIKRQFVVDALSRIGGLVAPEPVMHSGAPLAYRNRAQFRKGASGRPAFSMRASSALVEPAECPILVPAMQSWLGSLNKAGGLNKAGAVFQAIPPKEKFTVFAHGDSVHVEGVNEEVQVRVLEKDIRFSAAGFFQSNLGLLPELVHAACADLSGSRAADLYSGVGLFGSFLKDRFGRVTCVEHDARALGYASRNVGQGADFSASSMESWVVSAQARADYDLVVVDPPRTGLAASVSDWLGEKKAPVLVYVSCEPITMARDLGILRSKGYAVDSLDIFDFYPQTSHVESCVRLLFGGAL